MHKISEIIGLQVISLFEGQLVGYTKDFCLSADNKKITELLIQDNKDEENIFALDPKNIFKIKDAIFVKNLSVLTKKQNVQIQNSPINCLAFLTDGTSLGKLLDINLTKNFFINSFACSTCETNNRIFKLSNEVIIFNKPKSSLSYLTFKPVEGGQLIAYPVNTELQTIPVKTISDFNFLIGRKSSKDIFAFNNEILIRAGGLITDRVIHQARKAGKLKELAMYS